MFSVQNSPTSLNTTMYPSYNITNIIVPKQLKFITPKKKQLLIYIPVFQEVKDKLKYGFDVLSMWAPMALFLETSNAV